METFVARYRPLVTAVLSGFDRLVFRGTLLPLVRDRGMYLFLKRAGVQLLDFGAFVRSTSQRVTAASLAEARDGGRPIEVLKSAKTSKEEVARHLLARHPVDSGLICALTIAESCMSFEYHRSQDREERGLRRVVRKCNHVYKYYLHPRFGFLHARLQTWFPFPIQICINGREWLARQFAKRGHTDFLRHDNCFLRLGDPRLAQRLMDEQLKTDWARALDGIARSLHPLHDTVFASSPMDYYWSAYQSEWATDLLFKDPRSLAGIYPALVRHATHHFQSPDVMRFLGKKVSENYLGELTTSFKRRPEGVRVKHWAHGNSVKMYDKAGSVLRVETTLGNPRPFKVFRPLQDDESGQCAWRPLRKGIADLYRRSQVSQSCNERYLEALATVNDDTPASQVFDAVARPTTLGGRRVRALRIGDPQDLGLLQAISRGEFAIAGFRNADLRRILHPAKRLVTVEEARKLSARVSRQLRLLRAHGIIHKVPKSHRYRLSPKGTLLTAALFAARSATLKQLSNKAA